MRVSWAVRITRTRRRKSSYPRAGDRPVGRYGTWLLECRMTLSENPFIWSATRE
jgi:hypothetical protein